MRAADHKAVRAMVLAQHRAGAARHADNAKVLADRNGAWVEREDVSALYTDEGGEA